MPGAAVEEVLQHLLAVRGVHHLGVVLDAVELLLVVLEGGDRHHVRGGGDGEALGGGGAGVAVRHPHRLLGRGALEEGGAGPGDGAAAVRPYSRAPVLSTVPPSAVAISWKP